MDVTIELVIVFIALIIGSITDLKKREVPDFLNFSLIALGFGIAVIKSLFDSSFYPVIYSSLGFIIALAIALLMFYTGQWGGGDAKMLMGIGAIIGASFSFDSFFYSFLINTIALGAVYGLFWGIGLGIFNFKKLLIEMKQSLEDGLIKKIRIIVLIISALIILTIFIIPIKELKFPLIILSLMIFFTFYIFIFVKAIEKVCMIKKVKPSELTEGDWVLDEIKIGKKIIVSKKDLGISKDQITKLIDMYKKKKINLVTIKNGIPFVPSFLLGFIFTYFFGNIFIYLLSLM